MFKVCPRKMLRKPLVYKIYFYPFTYNAFILTRFLFYIRENMPSLNATPIFANLCAITFQGNASNSLQQDAFFFVDEKVANAPRKYHGASATLALLYRQASNPNQVIIKHIGDSRIYLQRSGNWQCLTHDHKVLNQIIAEKAEQSVFLFF